MHSSTNCVTYSSLVVPRTDKNLLSNISEGGGEMLLNDLSRQLGISSQTLVGWIDRRLVDARLGWSLSKENVELRTIQLDADTLRFLESFAAEYRMDTVTRPEARRLLKNADARVVKRLIRAGAIDTLQEGEELRVVVGSIEDYLIQREQNGND